MRADALGGLAKCFDALGDYDKALEASASFDIGNLSKAIDDFSAQRVIALTLKMSPSYLLKVLRDLGKSMLLPHALYACADALPQLSVCATADALLECKRYDEAAEHYRDIMRRWDREAVPSDRLAVKSRFLEALMKSTNAVCLPLCLGVALIHKS
nr:hypothetical protein HK105_001285 [Polyrhizophydium stewartii]